MSYGENPSKPAPLPKICISRNMGYKGPQPYIYGILAKQPGNYYKVRLHDMERTRMERLRMKYENDFKNLINHTVHKKMINVADRKCLYNQIKNMVECGMKANEHLFLDECTKAELKEEDQLPEQPKITVDDLLEKAEELNNKDNEEKRKLVEQKRLQMFINSSGELRSAAIAKRKKDIAEINYKIIQEKERAIKEQTTKKRELDNITNLEILKMQTFEKEEEKRKCLMKKEQFRKELYEQVQEKEVIRKLEKELKIVECNELKMLNEKLNKEEELEKLQIKQKKIQRNQEIKRFIKEREKLFSKMQEGTNMFNETLASTMQQILRDDAEDAEEAKMQLRRDDEMFKKHHAMIKEERRKQNEEISKTVMKQIEKIQTIKRSIELENAEARRKRAENGNKILIEQIKAREKLLEQQKDTKRKAYEQSVKEYEKYLEEERQLCEKKKKFKLQVRKDLNDQINFRKNTIEKQRKIDLENHQKFMKEIAEQEKLLEQLLNKIRFHHM